MRNVPRRIVITNAFDRSVKRRIEQVSATCRIPLQPGVRSHISEMMFADHEANMRRAIGPHDRVKQDGLALTIGDEIGVNLRRRFPLAGILIRDRAQARQPFVDIRERSPMPQRTRGRIQNPRDRSHLAIIWSGGDLQEVGLGDAGSSAQAETGSSQQSMSDYANGTDHGVYLSNHRAD